MKTKEDYEALKSEILKEFPDFVVESKSDSGLMKVIDVLLRVITFGQMSTFMSGFITTLGNTVYVSTSWESASIESKMIVLRHERVHMRQARKWSRPLFSAAYLLLPLPTVFAVCRRKFEQEAYEESLRAIQEYYGDEALDVPRLKEAMINHFTSAEYFWTWPWRNSISAWFDETVRKIRE